MEYGKQCHQRLQHTGSGKRWDNRLEYTGHKINHIVYRRHFFAIPFVRFFLPFPVRNQFFYLLKHLCHMHTYDNLKHTAALYYLRHPIQVPDTLFIRFSVSLRVKRSLVWQWRTALIFPLPPTFSTNVPARLSYFLLIWMTSFSYYVSIIQNFFDYI